MTEYHLLTLGDGTESRRSLVTGPLASSIRERFGATDSVYFHERQVESGGCHTCYSIDDVLTVECGDHWQTFIVDGEPVLNKLLAWLDAPRRQAEADAAKEVRRVQANEVMNAQIAGLTNVLTDLETEGYIDDRDWFNKLTAKLAPKREASHDG